MKRLQVAAILIAAEMGVVRLAWSDTEPIRIEYHADATCPSEQDFRKDVASRATRSAPRHGHDTRLFVVTMTGATGQAHGNLQIFDHRGSVLVRDVTGENCAEVASALALVTVLAIDPQASSDPFASAAPSAVSPNAPLPSAGQSPLAPSAGVPSAIALPPATNPQVQVVQSSHLGQSTVSLQESSYEPPKHASPRRTFTWRWSTGIMGLSMFNIVPKVAFGGGYFSDIEPSGSWTIWPDFRLAATYVTTLHDTRDKTGEVAARWWWLVARAEACPWRLATRDPELILRTCAGIDGGIITSNGHVLQQSNPETQYWFAVGPSLRLTWQTRSRLQFEIGSGLNFPLTRWNFTYIENDYDTRDFTHIRTWGWTLGGGISYQWR